MLSAAVPNPAERVSPRPPRAVDVRARQQQLVTGNLSFVWRVLCSKGVPRSEVDDAVQQVFLVASRRVEDIPPGLERSFLYGVAQNVAREQHRARRKQSDRYEADGQPEEHASGAAGADELLERKRRREQLERLMDELPENQREVFVLFELEGLELRQIAETLQLPQGTVASRLRLARERFRRAAERLRVRENAGGTL